MNSMMNVMTMSHNMMWATPQEWFGYEVKRVPMLPNVEKVLRQRQKACEAGEYLFKNGAGNKIVANKNLPALQRLFPQVGIGNDRRLHWHSFRNYFVVYCLKKGATVNAIMQWTGHDSASMVLHYAQAIHPDDVQAEFRKVMPPTGENQGNHPAG